MNNAEPEATPACRFCGDPLARRFCDLGLSPVSNAFVAEADLATPDVLYPLCAYVCSSCFLVQVPEVQRREEHFNDNYAYFSSFSDSWLAHARAYVDLVVERFGLDGSSRVIEVASNDGYLLQYFAQRGLPVLGIEPAANVAAAAEEKGVPTRVEFFGRACARRLQDEGAGADLLVGNNVLAHVPDINDFVAGLKIALKPGGVITIEFPHLLRLIEERQFDTIYHEHYSYLSWLAVERIFAHHALTLFDVEKLPTHGGSLRIYGRHADDASRPVTDRADALCGEERAAGLHELATYDGFQEEVEAVKRDLLQFLERARAAGETVAGYGAPAKGNTLLNYCGIGPDLLAYTVDRSPRKQGTRLPGVRIPVYAPEHIAEARPDYVLILPWNIRDEIMDQLHYIREWGGQFVVPIPNVEVLR